jgi:histidine triad (HIT) family protein
MPTLFSRIISGELPGRFVWKDERAVAFLTIKPIQPGHTLVVPRAEIDHWLDLPPELAAHLVHVSQEVGRGIQAAFNPAKVGMALVGLEVPHVHIHLVPLWNVTDLDFSKQKDATAQELDQAAEKIRTALRAMGKSQVAS